MGFRSMYCIHHNDEGVQEAANDGQAEGIATGAHAVLVDRQCYSGTVVR
jgi:hypothetical protein